MNTTTFEQATSQPPTTTTPKSFLTNVKNNLANGLRWLASLLDPVDEDQEDTDNVEETDKVKDMEEHNRLMTSHDVYRRFGWRLYRDLSADEQKYVRKNWFTMSIATKEWLDTRMSNY